MKWIIISLIVVLIIGINAQAASDNATKIPKSLFIGATFSALPATNSTGNDDRSANLHGMLKPLLQVLEYHSYESYNSPGKFIRHANGLGEISDYTEEVTAIDADDATFALVSGLADNSCVSFRSKNYPASYLRHQGGRVKLSDSTIDSSQLFKEDATFRLVSGLADSSAISFESHNYPRHFLRHDQNGHLWVEANDNSQQFKEDATFKQEAPRAAVESRSRSVNNNVQPSANVVMKWRNEKECCNQQDCEALSSSSISMLMVFMDDGTWGFKKYEERPLEIRGKWNRDGNEFWWHDDRTGKDHHVSWAEDKMYGTDDGCYSLTRES